jgi:hypothetical protein
MLQLTQEKTMLISATQLNVGDTVLSHMHRFGKEIPFSEHQTVESVTKSTSSIYIEMVSVSGHHTLLAVSLDHLFTVLAR